MGKVFYEHPLLEDQEQFLRQLQELLEDASYQALLIAGDVYDRSIPSPEAARLFSAFLGSLKARRPDLEVLVLPGNHDSPARLGFGKELFTGLGIHLVTSAGGAWKPILLQDRQDGAADAPVCAFFLLPFLNAACFHDTAPGLQAPDDGGSGLPIRSQGRLAAEAAARLDQAREAARAAGAKWAVLGAHCFTQEGIGSESERVFLGTAERVPAELFAGFDYAALGHLHRFQQAGKNAWYSGSPLAYSFAEAGQEKVVLSVELRPEASCSVEPVPVRPLRKLWRFTGSFNYFFRESVHDPEITQAEEDYLELILTDTTLVENPLPLLRRRFPRLLSISQAAAFAALKLSGQALGRPVQEREGRSGAGYFEDFLQDIYGAADVEKTRLFQDFLTEAEQEEAAL